MKNTGSRSAVLNNLLDFSKSLMPLIFTACLWKLSGLNQMTSKVPSRSNILTVWKGLKIDAQVYSWADHVHTITSKAFLHFYNRAFANDQRNFEVLFFLFWPHCTAHGTLVCWPGIEPMNPALQVWSLKHCTTREGPGFCFNFAFFLFCSKMRHMKLLQSKIKLIGV